MTTRLFRSTMLNLLGQRLARDVFHGDEGSALARLVNLIDVRDVRMAQLRSRLSFPVESCLITVGKQLVRR
jgi:hypothetical protein